MKKYKNMLAAAIDKKALKKAMQDEKSKKEILNILNKIKY